MEILNLPKPTFTLYLPSEWNIETAKQFTRELAQTYKLIFQGWLGVESYFDNNGNLLVCWKDDTFINNGFAIKYYSRV